MEIVRAGSYEIASSPIVASDKSLENALEITDFTVSGSDDGYQMLLSITAEYDDLHVLYFALPRMNYIRSDFSVEREYSSDRFSKNIDSSDGKTYLEFSYGAEEFEDVYNPDASGAIPADALKYVPRKAKIITAAGEEISCISSDIYSSVDGTVTGGKLTFALSDSTILSDRVKVVFQEGITQLPNLPHFLWCDDGYRPF